MGEAVEQAPWRVVAEENLPQPRFRRLRHAAGKRVTFSKEERGFDLAAVIGDGRSGFQAVEHRIERLGREPAAPMAKDRNQPLTPAGQSIETLLAKPPPKTALVDTLPRYDELVIMVVRNGSVTVRTKAKTNFDRFLAF